MIKPLERVYHIDFDLMEKMCHPIAVALFDSRSDPMGKFQEHERALLESALNNPRHSYYPTLESKAAILYYGLIKNHAFKNGNKRTATAALLTFLFINDYWIDNEQDVQDYLVTLATRVADSKGSGDKDAFLNEITAWLGRHIKPPSS